MYGLDGWISDLEQLFKVSLSLYGYGGYDYYINSNNNNSTHLVVLWVLHINTPSI